MDQKTNHHAADEFAVSGVPVAVFQMGKVGSETIVKSLQKRGSADSVHHVHVLANESIDRTLKNVQNENYRFPLQLRHSKVLREYLDRTGKSPINVITAVREPLAQLVSGVFQNIHTHMPHLIDENGVWKKEEIQEFLVRKIENYNPDTEWNCTWFTKEFEQALGINVYDYPFDLETGTATITENDIRILILRLESSEMWSSYVSDFLGLNHDFKLVKTNVATDKNYHSIYKAVKADLRFPEDVLDRIYSTRYCRHFYTEEMCQQFTARWSDQLPVVQAAS